MPNNNSPMIRRFKAEDINALLDIEKQAFPKTAYSRRTLFSYAKSLPDSFVIIEIGKDIVGYIIFDKSGHIHSTAVKVAHRRKGFGTMLLTHAKKCVKQRLWLEVRAKNTTAIEFYKALGMKIAGKIPNYYGIDDALIMVLNHKE